MSWIHRGAVRAHEKRPPGRGDVQIARFRQGLGQWTAIPGRISSASEKICSRMNGTIERKISPARYQRRHAFQIEGGGAEGRRQQDTCMFSEKTTPNQTGL